MLCSSLLLSQARQRRGRGWVRAALADGVGAAVGSRAAVGRIVSVASKLRRDRARRLRRDQTESETRLWDALRDRRLDGWKWRRQVTGGPFIVDFLCLEAAMAVELDGGIHAERADRDARRDAYLRARGLQVLRFWNAEVSTDLDRVCWTILSACRESDPSKRGRRVERRL